MNKEGIFVRPVRIEFPHDGRVFLGRLETENFPILVLDSVKEIMLDVIVFIIRMLETLFFPQFSGNERPVEAVFNIGWGKSFVSGHKDCERLISWRFSWKESENFTKSCE